MTYGQLRYRLSKTAPAVDLELIDGWIQDRYTEIMDALPWRRMEGETVYQWPASYRTGTIATTQGSFAITGTGTAWTAAMDGLMIRIDNGSEFYFFRFVDATHATLDRSYEGASNSTASYRVDQAVFTLPTSTRILRSVKPLHDGPPIEVISQAELNRLDPQRVMYGSPRYAALSFDSFTEPPIKQLELSPTPDATSGPLSYAVDYVYDSDALSPSQTSTALLPWVRPAALMAGVEADIAAHQGDAAKVEIKEARFAALLKQMLMINAQQTPPQAIRMAPEYRGGRRGGGSFRNGPPGPGNWHEGYNG